MERLLQFNKQSKFLPLSWLLNLIIELLCDIPKKNCGERDAFE